MLANTTYLLPLVDLTSYGLRVENYKGFKEPSGIDALHPITLLIGRNNTGKSALVDLVEAACGAQHGVQHELIGRGDGTIPIAWFTKVLSAEDVERAHISSPYHDTPHILKVQDPEFPEFWVGKRLVWAHGFDYREPAWSRVEPTEEGHFLIDNKIKALSSIDKTPFRHLQFRRIAADRDLVPERDETFKTVAENGSGATNLIQHFANKANRDRDLLKNDLLRDLNRIFEPDAHFTELVVRQHEGGEWEVFLREEGKGLVPLSQSGSGLKTVLLVLVFVHLLPASASSSKDQKLGSYVFAMEELENNLHPALQRRLFLYLRELALERGCHFVLTTHSNVVVDLFSDDKHARIVHVTHDGEKATATPVLTYSGRCGILDDLDVRASDLLQANGVVWVEGPTDRMYFNRWVSLWTDGELREGAHYQCVFYGGRLLAHLSADEPADEAEAVEILRVNRNAVVLIDSDKRHLRDAVGASKKRLVEEVERIGGYAWVTKGREVEHYIPAEAIRELFGEDVRPPEDYESYVAYLNNMKAKSGDQYAKGKVLFAEQVRPHITKDGLAETLDLGFRLDAVCARIREWNKVPAPAPAPPPQP